MDRRGQVSRSLSHLDNFFWIMLIAFFYARNLMLNGPEDLKKVVGPVFFWFCLNFLTISTLGLFTSLALKYWNRTTAVNQDLASNSYNMYLAHYPFVIVFQLVFLRVSDMTGLLKFVIVSTLSILCSYIVCEYLIKPFPRGTAAAVFIMFILMALVIHP